MEKTSQIDRGESLPLTFKQFLERLVTNPSGQKINEVHIYGDGREVREIENNCDKFCREFSLSSWAEKCIDIYKTM